MYADTLIMEVLIISMAGKKRGVHRHRSYGGLNNFCGRKTDVRRHLNYGGPNNVCTAHA